MSEVLQWAKAGDSFACLADDPEFQRLVTAAADADEAEPDAEVTPRPEPQVE